MGKLYLHGCDKQGHPLLHFVPRLNVPTERNLEDLTKVIIWWQEYAAFNLPQNMSKFSVLIDRTDVLSSNFDQDLGKVISTISEQYPERLHQCIVFPTGLMFYGLYAIACLFLDPLTQAKIKPMLYFEGVQELVADEYIPATMGGKSEFVFVADDFNDLPSEKPR